MEKIYRIAEESRTPAEKLARQCLTARQNGKSVSDPLRPTGLRIRRTR